MTKEWQQALVAKFPYQFPKGGFYFAIGDGWADLLAEMCRRVDVVLEEEWKDGESFRWTDIKEKFGSLRASNTGPEDVERIVEWAEEVSLRTCDICGQDGRIRRGGWVSVRCDNHEEVSR
ncbi:MAG: hypothetical protein EON48_01060 [Acetobacteraceae bacterium]|nr:MAG: hypothetical protein EON48_01060 [Acetobacteraceae bacterium]